MTFLKANALASGYGGAPIISDISVAAKPGHLIALIGPNGSGKSTLIKTLAGLLPVQEGEIWLGDDLLSTLDPRHRARQISYLAQERQAMPMMSVLEILELGRAPYRGRLGQISPKGYDAIDYAVHAAQLEEYLTRPFGQLSGGEQARVLMGRALAVDAPILLADEPIAALDPYYQLAVMDILKAEAARGKIVIAALHDLGLAHQFADQAWVMQGGKLRASDTPARAMSPEIIGDVFKIATPIDGFRPFRLLGSK